ncbi:MAG: hypothetical protein PHW66_06685 [Gallionella sp.]|nr:hypothetical protein [Gallionella sp.]
MTEAHRWKFFRAGGFEQVLLETGEDLRQLPALDQKLWAALNCPTRGVEFDPKTLALLDRDSDGQIRASDILDAVNWLASLLIDLAPLSEGGDGLKLSDINTVTEAGARVQASVRHLLKTLGKSESDVLTLGDMQDIEQRIAGLEFNGDGVICPAQIADADLRGTLETLQSCLPSVTDISGQAGVNQAGIETFFTDARQRLAWYQAGISDAEIFPLGNLTDTAFPAWQAVSSKIEDYFLRCRMAAYDSRAATPLNRAVEDYIQVAAGGLSEASPAIADFPIALAGADKALPLDGGINPAWSARLDAFRDKVVYPLLGERAALTQSDWQSLSATFLPHARWLDSQPLGCAASVSVARLQAILGGSDEATLRSLLAQDKAVEEEVSSVRSVERLLYLKRDLFLLANNFVSFRNFYTGKGKATFQIGTLYLDSRSCDLCVRVDDINKHTGFANSSGVCLIYCECTRNGGSEKMNIAAAFTAGDSDFLVTGRNGIFYDRQGHDWNATIVRILDHPISIRQAFWSPYKKLSKLISEQLQKFAASKASSVEGKMIKAVVENGKSTVEAGTATPAKPAFDVAKFAGIFAAIGLAIGAIGGIVASIVSGILGLKFWQIPLALAGLMLLISGPSMVLAWFKLKRRNLGPILDACGWAINARMQINIPFGTALTQVASLPQGATSSLSDPFAETRRQWPWWVAGILILLLVLWFARPVI